LIRLNKCNLDTDRMLITDEDEDQILSELNLPDYLLSTHDEKSEIINNVTSKFASIQTT
jgi:hypothetical protein